MNNAGAIPGGNLQDIDEARWREPRDMKVYGCINMCRRFYALMRQRCRGVLINILGMAASGWTPAMPRARPAMPA